MRQEPQRCPDCNRFLRRAEAVEDTDDQLVRMRAKFPNAGGYHWTCKRCGEKWTIYECSVVLSGPCEVEA